MNDLKSEVEKALKALALGSGEVLSHSESAWASLTFAGSRHVVEMLFEGVEAVSDGEELCEKLADHSFNIPLHLVADATVDAVSQIFGKNERMTIKVIMLLLRDDG